jgi:glutamyl-tRNA reductase
MSLLSVGLSHASAPIDLLERVAMEPEAVAKLLADLTGDDCGTEALVLGTCNRLEVYADVTRFHGGVQHVSESVAAACGVTFEELTRHLYVHYADKAVEHLFTVSAGLDSMVLGEQQILGQLRSALATARAEGAAGRTVGALAERALRVGKRVQTDTGLAAAGRSLVSVGLEVAAGATGGLGGRPVAVVGAGAISSLAATSLQRLGASPIDICNRTEARARRLAARVGGRPSTMADLPDVLVAADLVVSCTGSVGTVLAADTVRGAVAARAGRPLVLLDLALPRDVEPAAGDLAGVTLISLADLETSYLDQEQQGQVEAARRMIIDEVGVWLARQRADNVAPAVTALRARATAVVDAELTRLIGRLPDADERALAEIRQAMTRTVDKLLHAPTVRIKELGEAPGADTYTEALRDLFALDPATTAALGRATVELSDEDAAGAADVDGEVTL